MEQEDTLRIRSAGFDAREDMHEYRFDQDGKIWHRWIREDGSEYNDGRSDWTPARLDFIKQVVCFGRTHEVQWFNKRGYTCEKVTTAIKDLTFKTRRKRK